MYRRGLCEQMLQESDRRIGDKMSHCYKYSDGDLHHDGQPHVLVDGIIYLLLKFNNLNGFFFSLRYGKVLM